MAHLGADRLIDPPLTGMLLAIRRGLIEEMNAASMADYVLVDMAVIAFANAMRIQSIIGNTSLIIEKRDVRAADAAGEVEVRIWRQAGGHTWDRCRRACDTAARIAAAADEAIPPDGQRSDR
jgi:hypothetical protein